MTTKIKQKQRQQRHKKVRAKIKGTKERPRLCVFKSNRHISAQIIDDEARQTLVSAIDSEIKIKDKSKKTEIAEKLGELIAEKAKAKKIQKVVFDRAGYKYQGRVKALAEKARKGGLIF
ncbi:MAG: 50S ribosomal protein L18 [Candidatus Pacebacteria bacterium]|nr:50S ribosomal protein L18 [Candidatus Paceibacterota bacterium]MDD5721625.1 50S ribosomal protein L18 [Candidatus Paceibacterota bacterium]